MADLIELEYALDYLGLPRDAKDKAQLVPALISAASLQFEGLCQCSFLEQIGISEDLPGGRERLTLRRPFVSALTSITDRSVVPLVVKPTNEYRLDLGTGHVYRVDTITGIDTGAFWGSGRTRSGFHRELRRAGRNRWRAVYTAGFLIADVPADAKIAVADLVTVRWLRRDGGETEETRGDWKSRRELGIPQRVLDTAARYREETF